MSNTYFDSTVHCFIILHCLLANLKKKLKYKHNAKQNKFREKIRKYNFIDEGAALSRHFYLAQNYFINCST